MMRCESFRELVADVDREGALDAAVQAEALDHASGCPGCSVALAAERAIDADLRDLAEETQATRPPEHVEEALRTALREQAEPRPARSWGWAAAAATAALLLAGLWLANRDEVAPVHDAFASPEEGVSGYIPLGYGEPLTGLDSFLVVRVELTSASLAGLGWSGAAASDPVRADVLVGEDGIARAIRLVE